jgi:iron complex outermembrane recepter protein
MRAAALTRFAVMLLFPIVAIGETVRGPASAPVIAGAAIAAVADPSTPDPPAADPSTLDQVVVTARKKSEMLQQVPMSVSAFDGDELQDQGIHTLDDLAAAVPGLQQGDLAITSRLTLRGVNSGDNNAFEQAVGTYVDGIYRGRMNQQHTRLFDLERIEVLKGPQVTLYGNSSIGGAINVITRKPRFQPGGDVRYRYGWNYDEHEVEAGVDLPVGDAFAMRVAGHWLDQGEGLSPNDASGNTEPTTQDAAIRLSTLWVPSDALGVRLRHEQGRFDRDGSIFEVHKHVDGRGNPWPDSAFTGIDDGRLNIGNGDPFKYQESLLDTEMDETMLELHYHFDAFDLTAISGHSRYDYRQSADVDITPATLINVYQDERYRQLSQEVRISGRASDASDYLLGLYFQRDEFRNDYLSDFNTPVLLGSAFGVPASVFDPLMAPFSRHILLDQDTRQAAIFGNLNFDLGERLTASLGFRWQDIGKEADQAVRVASIGHVDGLGRLVDSRWLNPSLAPLLLGNAAYLADPAHYVLTLADGTQVAPALVPEHALGYAIVSAGVGQLHEFEDLSRDERHPMFQASLAWQGPRDWLLYASLASGAKAGGFDFLYEGADRDAVEYRDESADVLEVGFKKDWDALRLNLALFYGKYEDLQVSVYDGGIGFVVGNAASSISKGVDAELLWNLTAHLRLTANIEWLDFRYDDFPDANCSTTQRLNTGATRCDWSGDRAPFVPEVTGVFALEDARQTASGWNTRQRLSWSYHGDHSTASDNEIQTRQSAYGLLDYRLEVSPAASPWSVALLGRNLTNAQYNVFTSVIPLAPGGAFASVRARGREMSIELQFHF